MSFANTLRSGLLSLTALTAIGSTTAGSALAQQPQKPNILVIVADDIGYWDIMRLQPRDDGIPGAQHRGNLRRGMDQFRSPLSRRWKKLRLSPAN